MSGRSGTYFVKSQILYGNNANKYSALYGNAQPPDSRILEAIFAINRENSKLLIKAGKMASTIHSSFFFPAEAFHYILSRMASKANSILLLLSTRSRASKYVINHDNLSIQTTWQ